MMSNREAVVSPPKPGLKVGFQDQVYSGLRNNLMTKLATEQKRKEQGFRIVPVQNENVSSDSDSVVQGQQLVEEEESASPLKSFDQLSNAYGSPLKIQSMGKKPPMMKSDSQSELSFTHISRASKFSSSQMERMSANPSRADAVSVSKSSDNGTIVLRHGDKSSEGGTILFRQGEGSQYCESEFNRINTSLDGEEDLPQGGEPPLNTEDDLVHSSDDEVERQSSSEADVSEAKEKILFHISPEKEPAALPPAALVLPEEAKGISLSLEYVLQNLEKLNELKAALASNDQSKSKIILEEIKQSKPVEEEEDDEAFFLRQMAAHNSSRAFFPQPPRRPNNTLYKPTSTPVEPGADKLHMSMNLKGSENLASSQRDSQIPAGRLTHVTPKNLNMQLDLSDEGDEQAQEMSPNNVLSRLPLSAKNILKEGQPLLRLSTCEPEMNQGVRAPLAFNPLRQLATNVVDNKVQNQNGQGGQVEKPRQRKCVAPLPTQHFSTETSEKADKKHGNKHLSLPKKKRKKLFFGEGDPEEAYGATVGGSQQKKYTTEETQIRQEYDETSSLRNLDIALELRDADVDQLAKSICSRNEEAKREQASEEEESETSVGRQEDDDSDEVCVSNSEEESHNKVIIVQPLSIANKQADDELEEESKDSVRQLPEAQPRLLQSPLIEEDKSEEMSSPFVLSPEQTSGEGSPLRKPPLGFKKAGTQVSGRTKKSIKSSSSDEFQSLVEGSQQQRRNSESSFHTVNQLNEEEDLDANLRVIEDLDRDPSFAREASRSVVHRRSDLQ